MGSAFHDRAAPATVSPRAIGHNCRYYAYLGAWHGIPCFGKQIQKTKQMSTNRTIAGVLAGLAAGAALGLLFAPQSGKETRRMIRRKSEEAKDQLSDLLDQGFEKWQETKDAIIDRANMTKEEIKDFLGFMAEEGADLKERVKRDAKDSARKTADQARRTASQVANNHN